MTVFREVEYSLPERSYEEEACPRCGKAKVYASRIPCPRGLPGCLVLHQGYVCDDCGAILQRLADTDG